MNRIHYNGSDYIDENNKSSKSNLLKNRNNKYNDKVSYYLTAKNPWNNSSVFDDRDKNDINKKITENIKEVKKKNFLWNIYMKNGKEK